MDEKRKSLAKLYDYRIKDENEIDMFVPWHIEKYPNCDGMGVEPFDCDDDDLDCEPDDCWDCKGRGKVEVLDWDNALTVDEFDALCQQRARLNKRYGTWKVNSVADYWTKA